MSKSIVENTNRLSVFFLKKHGYLPQGKSSNYGGIKWTRGDWENNISFLVSTAGNESETSGESYVELIYTVTPYSSGEKADIRYKVPLVTAPCHYGGKRYWFICPLSKNGIYCGKRVGVIYFEGKYFGCRYCTQVAYQSQMHGGRYKGFVSIPDIEHAKKEVKRAYYNGKPTRKYKRVIKLNRKFEIGFIMATERLNKQYRKFV